MDCIYELFISKTYIIIIMVVVGYVEAGSWLVSAEVRARDGVIE